MQSDPNDRDAAVFPDGAHCHGFQATIELIGKRWTGAILRTLFAGCSRFTDIAEAFPGLSNRLLSERLDELKAAGLVTSDGGSRGVYSLTEKGGDLRQILTHIEAWNQRWLYS